MEDEYFGLLKNEERSENASKVKTDTESFKKICSLLVERVLRPCILNDNPCWLDLCCWSFSRRKRVKKIKEGEIAPQEHTKRLNVRKYFKHNDLKDLEAATLKMQAFLKEQAGLQNHLIDNVIKIPFLNKQHPEKYIEEPVIRKETAQAMSSKISSLENTVTDRYRKTESITQDLLTRIIMLENTVSNLKANDLVNEKRLELLEREAFKRTPVFSGNQIKQKMPPSITQQDKSGTIASKQKER